jgi:hypothetical protein
MVAHKRKELKMNFLSKVKIQAELDTKTTKIIEQTLEESGVKRESNDWTRLIKRYRQLLKPSDLKNMDEAALKDVVKKTLQISENPFKKGSFGGDKCH